MYLMSFCERYALNSSNLDHYTTEQSSVAVVCWSRDWPMLWEIPITYGCHSLSVEILPVHSCLALQIVSMEEWCYSAIKEHISKILTIFILQNGFPLKWFLNILIICMQICLTTDVAQTEKKQIHFCFPWYFQNGLIFLLRKNNVQSFLPWRCLCIFGVCMIFWTQPAFIYWWVSAWLRICSGDTAELH